MIEIRGKKGKTTKAVSVCSTGGTVVGNALRQAGQRQCWVTRVLEPGTAWLTGAAEEESISVTQYSPTQPFSVGTKPH